MNDATAITNKLHLFILRFLHHLTHRKSTKQFCNIPFAITNLELMFVEFENSNFLKLVYVRRK